MGINNSKLNQINNIISFIDKNQQNLNETFLNKSPTQFFFLKKGNKIQIKKANKGKFTDYCNGKVTSECIAKGKQSKDPKIRKRATFAANARKWKHESGGTLSGNKISDKQYIKKFKQSKNR